MSVRIKERPEESKSYIKYRVRPVICNGALAVYMRYVIQKNTWFGWLDESAQDENKERMQRYCDELNEFYNNK
jgi:CRISPR/Cas system-associated protein Cas7 (RAMP superfamily)